MPHQARDLRQRRPALGPAPVAHQLVLLDQPAMRSRASTVIAWSATSSIKVSGQLVTGMPFAVAASTSTESTPTLPSEMILQRSSPSIICLVIRRPLA